MKHPARTKRSNFSGVAVQLAQIASAAAVAFAIVCALLVIGIFTMPENFAYLHSRLGETIGVVVGVLVAWWLIRTFVTE